ncbi:hypothetical protein ACFLWV_01580 [Chloroflexota bacterium]
MLGLQAGDIVAVKGKGILAWFSRNAFIPHTDRFHFFLVDRYIEEENDYCILESIRGKGVTVGRLSWYKLEDLEIYRLNAPDAEIIGRKAVSALTIYGRARYDYILLVRLFISALRLILSLKLPPWKISQLPYVRNNRLLCVEAIDEAYRAVKKNLFPSNNFPGPAAFKQVLAEGKLVMVYQGSSQRDQACKAHTYRKTLWPQENQKGLKWLF